MDDVVKTSMAIGAYVVTSVVAERRETSKWRSQGMPISDSRGGIRSPDEGKAGAMSSNRWAGKGGTRRWWSREVRE